MTRAKDAIAAHAATTGSAPLRFEPLLKERVWGGRRLESFGLRLPPGTPIGEAWLLADLPDSFPDARTPIANEPSAGTTLRAAIAADPQAILGDAAPSDEGGFPLLLKLLDARENLSVQVHPTPSYVRCHPGCHVKSEAWIVLEAAPGAVIYKGLRPARQSRLDAETFRRRVADGSVIDDLEAIEVRPGDCHYLPSGTCHALGAGILVAEVQTTSDTTFRVFDWGRTGRELHLDSAVECIFDGSIEAGAEDAILSTVTLVSTGVRRTRLCTTPHFAIDRVAAPGASEGGTVEFPAARTPRAVMQLSGTFDLGGGAPPLVAGRAALLPAACPTLLATLSPRGEALVIELPAHAAR